MEKLHRNSNRAPLVALTEVGPWPIALDSISDQSHCFQVSMSLPTNNKYLFFFSEQYHGKNTFVFKNDTKMQTTYLSQWSLEFGTNNDDDWGWEFLELCTIFVRLKNTKGQVYLTCSQKSKECQKDWGEFFSLLN